MAVGGDGREAAPSWKKKLFLDRNWTTDDDEKPVGLGHCRGAAVSLEETQARVEPFFGPSEVEAAARRRGCRRRGCRCRRELAGLRFRIGRRRPRRARHGQGLPRSGARLSRRLLRRRPTSSSRPADERELTPRRWRSPSASTSRVTPFGGGSSVVGGVEPKLGRGHRGALSLDLARLGRLLELDDVSHTARIEAGVFGPALEQQLGAHGFTLRHYPQSFEFSTLGGWIATRAGGHFATVLTHIDELVQAVRMVTPRGALRDEAASPRAAPGSIPTGSSSAARAPWASSPRRGCACARARRSAPAPRCTSKTSRRAVEATRAIAQSGLSPSNCRLLDAQEAMINGVTFDGRRCWCWASSRPITRSTRGSIAPSRSRESFGGTCPKGKTSGARPGDAAESWRASFLKGPYLQDAMIHLGTRGRHLRDRLHLDARSPRSTPR